MMCAAPELPVPTCEQVGSRWRNSQALRQEGARYLAQQRFAEAVHHFRAALLLEPAQADISNDLAIALARRGRLDEAVECLGELVRRQPQPAACHNLGLLLARQGRFEEAVQTFRQTLRLAPSNALAHHHLAQALTVMARFDSAIAAWREAVRLQPDLAEAWCQLGELLLQQGRPEEARASLLRAVQVRPDLAVAHWHLGLACTRLGELDAALEHYRQVLWLPPEQAVAHRELGPHLRGRGHHAEALAHLSHALRRLPEDAETHNDLALALLRLGRTEALEHFRSACRLASDSAEYACNLAVALRALGYSDEARAHLEAVVAHDPDYAPARFTRAITWLERGDFARGWPELEWRLRMAKLTPPPAEQPRWDGSPLEGRTILLQAEQGLGDTLHFARYVPLVQQRGGRVLLSCQRALHGLLGSLPGVERLLAADEPTPRHDVQAPLMSLPGILATTFDDLPATVPYLWARPELVERWRQELGQTPGYKVGIVWQGNPQHPEDHLRSVSLHQFAALAGLPGVQLFSLQKGPGQEQLRSARAWPLIDLGARLDQSGPFLDTAAVLKGLDLIVTVDSAVAHLAGALAVPVWVVLHLAPDWRWLEGRDDSPWYPTMRLFRQRHHGDWDDVFDRIAAALHQRITELPQVLSPTGKEEQSS
jgi:tetratricopeptide (TPR) repeat protein